MLLSGTEDINILSVTASLEIHVVTVNVSGAGTLSTSGLNGVLKAHLSVIGITGNDFHAGFTELANLVAMMTIKYVSGNGLVIADRNCSGHKNQILLKLQGMKKHRL